MFSDAALAIAVDTTTKWLYNASRRLKRPLERSLTDVSWWRLTHHLAGRLGVPLADAARASDLLLRQGSDLSKVRLRSTPDDSVAIGVDLARFHDGAALAAAAALYLATPRRRGRPRRTRRAEEGSLAPGGGALAGEANERFSRAVASVPSVIGAGSPIPVVQILAALASVGVPSVITGGIAAAFHGDVSTVSSLDLVAELSARHSRSLSTALNALQASPRGVGVREGFRFDSGLVRSAPCLALRVGGVAVNIAWALPGIGEYPQASEASSTVLLDQMSLRVISREALTRAVAALARVRSPA